MLSSSFPSFSMQRELLGTLRSQWRDAILQALQNSKRNMARPKRLSKYSILYPYLCLLPDEEYVDIMMQVGACLALTAVGLDVSLSQSTNVPPEPAELEFPESFTRLLGAGCLLSLQSSQRNPCSALVVFSFLAICSVSWKSASSCAPCTAALTPALSLCCVSLFLLPKTLFAFPFPRSSMICLHKVSPWQSWPGSWPPKSTTGTSSRGSCAAASWKRCSRSMRTTSSCWQRTAR